MRLSPGERADLVWHEAVDVAVVDDYHRRRLWLSPLNLVGSTHSIRRHRMAGWRGDAPRDTETLTGDFGSSISAGDVTFYIGITVIASKKSASPDHRERSGRATRVHSLESAASRALAET